MVRHHHGSVLFRTVRVVESANLLFFLGTLLVLALFVMGNYQEFMDRSQLLLLQIVFLLGLLCLGTGVFYLVVLVAWMAQRRRVLVLRILYAVLAITAGGASAVGTGALQAVVQTT